MPTKIGDSLFRELLNSAPDAMVIADVSGTIVLVNSQTTKLFGYLADDLQPQVVEILVPERFRTAHVGNRDQFSSEPHTRALGPGLALFGLRKDGTEFPVEPQPA